MHAAELVLAPYPERERIVCSYRMGLGDGTAYSVPEIGNIVGVAEAGAVQIFENAVNTLVDEIIGSMRESGYFLD